MQIPVSVVERIGQYRRILQDLKRDGTGTVCSHHLAERAGVTAAQVRRDMMVLKSTCGTRHGYPIDCLLNRIAGMLDNPTGENVAIAGTGNLGRALLAYFSMSGPRLRVAVAFDTDPDKIGRVFNGCRCHGPDDMARVMAEQGIRTVMLAVPARSAQAVAERLVECGATGILNFAPVPLRLPAHVFVEQIDMTLALEKVAFFSRRTSREERT